MVSLAVAASPGAAADGSDYPGLGRFAGSAMTGYAARDFDATVIEARAFRSGRPLDERRPEGRVIRIAYRVAGGASILEVFRNYTAQAARAGFETLLECETKACGGRDFALALDTLPLPAMWLDGFDFRYYSGKRDAGAAGPAAYLSVATSRNGDNVYTQVTVVELAALENRMVGAAEMARGLAETGHIALYGIYFDTDQATLRPDSAPTLAEIARLLESDAALTTVYVVGHTDSRGGFEHNLELSRRRAEAVAAELAKSYGLDAARLKTAGVGCLAPVASNASDEGRALNRRTELVVP